MKQTFEIFIFCRIFLAELERKLEKTSQDGTLQKTARRKPFANSRKMITGKIGRCVSPFQNPHNQGYNIYE